MNLDEKFWNDRYLNDETGWDLGEVSPPLKGYIDTLKHKSLKILIPGAGNAHELGYLIENGFQNVTVIDIAPELVKSLKDQYSHADVQIIHGDYFDHDGQYDLILEQTFFCALDPNLRSNYVSKMNDLLKEGGKLCGVLFNRSFEGGPPFGGNKEEYQKLFKDFFVINKLEECYNSHSARKGNEVWIELEKQNRI